MKTKQFLITALTCVSLFSTSMHADVGEVFNLIAYGDSKTLIKHIENNPECAYETNKYGQTPLHVVAKTIFHSDKENQNHLTLADSNLSIPQLNDGIEVMETLFLALKSFDADEYFYEKLNSQDENGNTPLHLATKKQLIHYIWFLRKNGADHSIKNNKGFDTLELALKACNPSSALTKYSKNSSPQNSANLHSPENTRLLIQFLRSEFGCDNNTFINFLDKTSLCIGSSAMSICGILGFIGTVILTLKEAPDKGEVKDTATIAAFCLAAIATGKLVRKARNNDCTIL